VLAARRGFSGAELDEAGRERRELTSVILGPGALFERRTRAHEHDRKDLEESRRPTHDPRSYGTVERASSSRLIQVIQAIHPIQDTGVIQRS
jgi:hypothetical protein